MQILKNFAGAAKTISTFLSSLSFFLLLHNGPTCSKLSKITYITLTGR
jgi:hypothetical protein